jgi:hypothetical protein
MAKITTPRIVRTGTVEEFEEADLSVFNRHSPMVKLLNGVTIGDVIELSHGDLPCGKNSGNSSKQCKLRQVIYAYVAQNQPRPRAKRFETVHLENGNMLVRCLKREAGNATTES